MNAEVMPATRPFAFQNNITLKFVQAERPFYPEMHPQERILRT